MVLTRISFSTSIHRKSILFLTGVVLLSYWGGLLDQLKRTLRSELGGMVQPWLRECGMLD